MVEPLDIFYQEEVALVPLMNEACELVSILLFLMAEEALVEGLAWILPSGLLEI